MRNFVIAALAGALIVIISASLPSLAGENAGLQAVAYPIAVALFIPYVCFMLPAVLDGGREMTALYALFAALSILTVFYIAESSARGYGRMRLLVLEGALVCMMSLSFAVFMISLGITNTAILSFPIAIAVLIYILAALVEIVPPEGVGAESNANEAPTSSNHIEYIPEPEESPVSEEVPEAIDYSDIILLDAEDTGESYSAIVVGDEDESPAYEAIAVSEDDDNEAITAIDKSSSISDDVITAAQINQNDEEIEEEAIVVDEDSVIEEKALSFETVETEEIPAIAIDSEDELAAIQAISLDNTESISTASISSFFSDDAEEVNALLIDEAEETSVVAILVDVEGSEDLPAIIKEEDKPEELPVSVVEESEDEVLPVAVIDAEDDTVVPVIVDSAEESQMLIIEEEDIPETELATQLPDEVYEEIAVDAEETSAVPAPPVLSVSTSLSVPTAPSITNTAHLSAPSAPVLTNTAELVEGIPRDMLALQHADDFWSSFYIQGQDDLLLQDGVYYMTLIINNNEVGTITTVLTDGEASINSEELRAYLSGSITDEAEDRIFFNRGEYLSIAELKDSGLQAEFDSNTYTVTLTFSTADMPIQILSVREGGIRSRGTLNRLPIANATILDPAVFTWAARYTLSGSFGILPFSNFVNSLRLNFRMDNDIRLYDVYLDFDFALRANRTGVQFDWGTYEFHYDFEDAMVRLSWGNVSSDLLSPDGTDIGIRFDKAVSYGGPDAARKSHIERYITIDRDSEVVILNEGREIFRRTLSPGNYRLEDFILYTGANKIQIIVTPLDGSPAQESEIDLIYSSSLLAPGEMYYGASLVTGRNLVLSDSNKIPGSLRIPLMNGYSLEYDFRNISVGGYVEAGLTETLTLDTSLAFRNSVSETSLFQPTIAAAFELTHANVLGTTRYNLNITEDSDNQGNFVLPEIYARIGHQVYTDWRALNALNFGFTYNTDLANRPDRHSFMLSSSMSGTLGILGWGLSLSGTLRTDEISDPLYSASLTLSLSASRNVYFSAGLSVSGVGADSPSVFGRASATIRFNPTRTSINASNNRLSADFSVNDNKHSFSVSAETEPREIAVFDSYAFDADYSYSGSLFNVGVGLYADNSFERMTGNFSVSTSSVFADGLMGFASYIPSNYILISQKGALKGNDISVGAVGSSMSSPLDKRFGVGMYTGISLDRASSLTVFSVNNESFGSATAFDIAIPPIGRGGYTLRLSAENKYSVSGVVILPDGSSWTNGSSPIYMVVETEDSVAIEHSEYYAFTDNDGRFIISDLPAGRYAFDVNFGDDWFLYEFSVYENEEKAVDIQMLDNLHLAKTSGLPDAYTAMYSFDNGEYLTGDEFWAMLYPEFMEDAI